MPEPDPVSVLALRVVECLIMRMDAVQHSNLHLVLYYLQIPKPDFWFASLRVKECICRHTALPTIHD